MTHWCSAGRRYTWLLFDVALRLRFKFGARRGSILSKLFVLLEFHLTHLCRTTTEGQSASQNMEIIQAGGLCHSVINIVGDRPYLVINTTSLALDWFSLLWGL